MDKKEIIEKVNRFLTEEIEIEEELIKPEANLIKDLGIDSLDIVDIIVIIESQFGIRIKSEEFQNVTVLQDFYDFIYEKVNNKE